MCLIQSTHSKHLCSLSSVLHRRYAVDRRTDMDHLFNVHPGNGSVFLLKSLDREESAWHNISVIATELRKSRGGQGCLQRCLQKNVYNRNGGNVQNYLEETCLNGYFCLWRSHFCPALGKGHLFQPSDRLYSLAQMKITFWFEWNQSFIFYKTTPAPTSPVFRQKPPCASKMIKQCQFLFCASCSSLVNERKSFYLFTYFLRDSQLRFKSVERRTRLADCLKLIIFFSAIWRLPEETTWQVLKMICVKSSHISPVAFMCRHKMQLVTKGDGDSLHTKTRQLFLKVVLLWLLTCKAVRCGWRRQGEAHDVADGDGFFSVYTLQTILGRAAMFLCSSICSTSMTTRRCSQPCTKPLSARGQKLARYLSVCLSVIKTLKIPSGQQTQAATPTGCKTVQQELSLKGQTKSEHTWNVADNPNLLRKPEGQQVTAKAGSMFSWQREVQLTWRCVYRLVVWRLRF